MTPVRQRRFSSALGVGLGGWMAVMAAVALTQGFASPCKAAATARCSSKEGGTKNTGADDTDWARWTPAGAGGAGTATITWTRKYDTDFPDVCPPLPGPPTEFSTTEVKFGAGPAARNWTGFNETCPSPVVVGRTRSTGDGFGSSTVVLTDWFPYRATWKVSAGGLPGAVAGGEYRSYAKGKDPWPGTAATFAHITGSLFDLYVPLGIDGGSSDGTGGGVASRFGFDVSYEAGTGPPMLLLHIELSGTQVVDVSGPPSGVRYFLMPTANSAPTTLPQYEISLSGIGSLRSLLEADLSGNSQIDTPLTIGVFVKDLPVPTLDLGQGVLANLHVDAFAYDSGNAPASIPTVSEWGLVVMTLFVLVPGTIVIGRRRLAHA